MEAQGMKLRVMWLESRFGWAYRASMVSVLEESSIIGASCSLRPGSPLSGMTTGHFTF